MCEALRELMKDEINKEVAEAEEHGREQGIEQGIDTTIRNMLDSGDFTDQQICIVTGKSIEYIRELKKK